MPRTNLCLYVSGLLCLAANSLVAADSSSIGVDDAQIKDEAMDFLTLLEGQTDHNFLKRSTEAYRELEWHRRRITASSHFL